LGFLVAVAVSGSAFMETAEKRSSLRIRLGRKVLEGEKRADWFENDASMYCWMNDD
jgi:hypothetical protein